MRRRLLIGLISVTALAFVVAATAAWLAFAPNTPDYDGTRSVKIPRGTPFPAAVDSLESAGIIGSPTTLSLVARATGWGSQVKAGHYRFESGASNYDLLSTLRRGLQSPIRVTIPPGTRPAVVAAVSGAVMAFDRDDMEAALRDSSLANELGTDTTFLFSFMLPESYDFYWLSEPETVVRRVKEYFDRFYERELEEAARRRNLTREEVVTLASIIEWETHAEGERARIAGVYLNRLRIGMALQADPTIQYAVMQREGSKRRLLFADYDIDHPYNTYKVRGLPPGPLNNPSPASLRAVAQAEDHDYLYFVATGDGDHVFSRTFREHVNAANRYRSLMQERRRQQAEAARESETQ